MSEVFSLARPILTEAAILYGHIFQFDLGRYLIGAGGVFFLINILLSRALIGRKIRNKSPGARQMAREAATSVRSVAVYGFFGLSIFALRDVGLIDVYWDPAERGWGYFVFTVVALIVLHDAWFYWTHRLIHDPRLFRRFHRTHHKSHNPSPWTAYSFDVGEAAINALFVPLALMLIPAAPLAVFLFLGHMMLRNAVGHCGYELFPSTRGGRPMFDWMTSVTHHDLHHAQAGWNYGLYFTWWDRMMGTEHPQYHEKFAAAVRKPLDGSAVAALTTPRAPQILVALVASAIIFVASVSSPSVAQEAATDPAAGLDGVWATEGHGAHIAFEACDYDRDRLCGRMIWSWDPALATAVDGYLLGDFTIDEGGWDDGWLANPQDGRTYRGKISLNEDGALRLQGCAFIFCRTQVWRRLDDVPGCAAAAAREAAARPACCSSVMFAVV